MITEAQFQTQVTDLLTIRGYWVHHHYDSRRSEPGWPDLVALGWGRALFLELKTAKGRVRPAQTKVLRLLSEAGLEVALLRPADLGVLSASLGPSGGRLNYPLGVPHASGVAVVS